MNCACFEYVGDNPYCPVHGKEAQVLVVRTSRAGGKMIATLEPSSAARAAEASDACSMPARIVVEGAEVDGPYKLMNKAGDLA